MTNQNITTFNETSNPITSFNFNDISFRVITKDSEPWFIVSDICAVLEINNPSQAISYLDDDEKNTLIINEGNRGNPEKAIINESGLYSLILRSRKPEAKRFKKWVTSEVLPSIRKTGSYSLSPSQHGGITKVEDYDFIVFLSTFSTGMLSAFKASLINRRALSALLGTSSCFALHLLRALSNSSGKRISNRVFFFIGKIYNKYASYVNTLTRIFKYDKYVLTGMKDCNFHTSIIINAILGA